LLTFKYALLPYYILGVLANSVVCFVYVYCFDTQRERPFLWSLFYLTLHELYLFVASIRA